MTNLIVLFFSLVDIKHDLDMDYQQYEATEDVQDKDIFVQTRSIAFTSPENITSNYIPDKVPKN